MTNLKEQNWLCDSASVKYLIKIEWGILDTEDLGKVKNLYRQFDLRKMYSGCNCVSLWFLILNWEMEKIVILFAIYSTIKINFMSTDINLLINEIDILIFEVTCKIKIS